MTESDIFKTLLEHAEAKETYDFPKTQTEAVEIISKIFTDIIYNSLKVKSQTANWKRERLLKTIVRICHRSSGDDFTPELLVIEEFLRSSDESDEIERDYSIFDRISQRQRRKTEKLEFIKKHDERRSDLKYNMPLRKLPFQQDEALIVKGLLKSYYSRNNKEKIENSIDYRYKLIQLGYAMLQVDSTTAEVILLLILDKLTRCKPLNAIEENFVYHLWFSENKSSKVEDILKENFFFVLERFIIISCTDVLKSSDIDSYWEGFERDRKTLALRKIRKDHKDVNLKIKSLIYELYCYSHCNENVLRMITI